MTTYSPVSGSYECYTRPIVDAWEGLLRRARDAKKVFNERGAQIESFYSGGAGAMWEPKYLDRFMGGGAGIQAPKFKITMNVAFEHVAILGPLLFWEISNRKVSPHRSIQLDPQAMAGGDEEALQYFSELAQQQAMDDARNAMRANVLEHMLNYFQREQPGGGLCTHSDLAVFEALTKGAGFLKTEDYQFPFSDRKLVGSFFQPCDDVLVDPDCRDPLWNKARWIAIRHTSKFYEVEEHFGLPAGSLRYYSSLSTPSAAYQAGGQTADRKLNATKDLVEWYEVFSRAGMGNKLCGTKAVIEEEFDRARGDDFAYLCICPGCPFPLNLPAKALVQDYATPEWLKSQTDWPTEYWRDNKWPVTKLDFYPHSGTSPWPEPPLAPALGELTCLNILISAYVQGAYDNRQQIIGMLKGAVEDVQGIIQSNKSPLILELEPALHKSVNDVISFMNRPEVNGDLPKTIEFLLSLVEKRTGLSDMLYGGNAGANPRSATEYQGKLDTVNIRPEHMQRKVAAWQSEIADKEVLCAYVHVRSSDISEQLGPLGVAAWDELVTNEEPESILRGSKAVIEASDLRRPNKARDMADLQGMQQYYMPVLAGELAQHNNPGPLNGFIRAISEAGDLECESFLIPEPQPDESAQQMQEAELAKVQAEVEKLQADALKSRTDAQVASQQGESAQHDAELKMATAEHGMALKQQASEHDLQVKSEQAQLAAAAKMQEIQSKSQVHAQSLSQRNQEAQQKLATQLMQAHQGMRQNAAKHLQNTAIADSKADDDARRSNMITQSKLLMSAVQHQQRMQQQNSMGAKA